MVQNEALLAVMARGPVLPVVTVEEPPLAVDLANALLAGGIDTIEITLRTAQALDCVRAVTAAVPAMTTGVGTVLDGHQLVEARRAGAAFAVSPGAAPNLLDAAQDGGLPLLPGAATASEIMRLLERGWRAMKFFPAEPAGGVAALRALASPLPKAAFCPTGGITPASAPTYLALGNVRCVGGSWLTPRAAVARRDWAQVTALAKAARAMRGG